VSNTRSAPLCVAAKLESVLFIMSSVDIFVIYINIYIYIYIYNIVSITHLRYCIYIHDINYYSRVSR